MNRYLASVTFMLVSSIFIPGFGFAMLENSIGADAATNTTNTSAGDTDTNGVNTTGTESPDHNGSIVLLSQKLKKGIGSYNHLVGEVKNIGNDTAQFVKIGLTTYDKNGGVLGTDDTYAKAQTLKASQKSAFDMVSPKDNFEGMDSYQLYLQWDNPDGSEGYIENAQIFKINETQH
jgi:hypothetical protein